MPLFPPIDKKAAEALKKNIKNLIDKRTEHPLEYLKERAKLALDDDRLIAIASRKSGNAAKKIALEHNYDEDRAQSCRFLAIIWRDHGESAFKWAVQEHKENKHRKILRDKLVPRIQLLEALAGAPLLITNLSQDTQMSLSGYLLAGPPARLEVKMILGDFKIYMKVAMEKVQGLVLPNISYRLVKNGVGLAKRSATIIRKNIGRDQFLELMLRQILSWVGRRDYIKGYEEMPLIAAVIEDIESRGEKFPRRLSSWSTINVLIETGSVDELKKTIGNIRASHEQEGYKPDYMRYFDYEANWAIAQAERVKRKLDPNIELIEKVNYGIIDSFISAYRVPGEDCGLGTNFLLVHQIHGNTGIWLNALRETGFSGCHVFSTPNLPSAMDIVQTGQIDVLLLDESLAITESRNWLKGIEKNAPNNLVSFVHYENEPCLTECLRVMAEEEF